MVVIRVKYLPPSQLNHNRSLIPHWLLGHIVKTYVGNVKLIRVVEVRTKNGNLRRLISKLGVLPIQSES